MNKIITLAAVLFPFLTYAITALPSQPIALGQINNANDLITRIVSIGNVAIYLLIALAIIFIVYNVVMFIIKGNDSAKKQEAGGNIGWGFLGLFIILSIWGIVNILMNTFGTNTNAPVSSFPTANFLNGNGVQNGGGSNSGLQNGGGSNPGLQNGGGSNLLI